jgi:hypothetical protein
MTMQGSSEFTSEKMDKYLTTRIVRGVSRKEILEYLKAGKEITFLVTKNFEILVDKMWHDGIYTRENLGEDDIIMKGSTWPRQNREVFVDHFYLKDRKLSNEEILENRRIVKRKVNAFLSEL